MIGRLERKGRGGRRRGRGAARACFHSGGFHLPCVHFPEAVAEAPCCPFHAPFVFPSGFTPSTPLPPPAVTLPAPSRRAADPAPAPPPPAPWRCPWAPHRKRSVLVSGRAGVPAQIPRLGLVSAQWARVRAAQPAPRPAIWHKPEARSVTGPANSSRAGAREGVWVRAVRLGQARRTPGSPGSEPGLRH